MAVVRPGTTTTVMRSRRPSASWVPEDAEELADIGIWQTSRVASVEEPHGGYQLFSKRAQELVKNSSLRFGTTAMFVAASEPPDHGAAGPVHGLSRRSMRRLSLDMSSLLTSSCSRTFDELYCMETIHSPSSEILHPMRSLFLDKISSGSASPPELLSPSPKSQQPASPPAPEVESDKINNTHEQHDQPPVVSSSSLSRELGEEEEEEEEEEESEAAAAVELERRPHVVTVDHDKQSCLPARQELSDTSAAPNVPVDVVMLVYDAERKPMTTGLEYAINKIVKEGDEIILVGYLQHVMNPST